MSRPGSTSSTGIHKLSWLPRSRHLIKNSSTLLSPILRRRRLRMASAWNSELGWPLVLRSDVVEGGVDGVGALVLVVTGLHAS